MNHLSIGGIQHSILLLVLPLLVKEQHGHPGMSETEVLSSKSNKVLSSKIIPLQHKTELHINIF